MEEPEFQPGLSHCRLLLCQNFPFIQRDKTKIPKTIRARYKINITVISYIAVQLQNENSFIVFLLFIEAMLPLSKTIQTLQGCTVQELGIPIMLSLCLMPEIATYNYLFVLGMHVHHLTKRNKHYKKMGHIIYTNETYILKPIFLHAHYLKVKLGLCSF